jgi:hypothetical protein
MFLTEKGRDLAINNLVPKALEFNKYVRGMVEPDIAGIFQPSLNLLDKQINKV